MPEYYYEKSERFEEKNKDARREYKKDWRNGNPAKTKVYSLNRIIKKHEISEEQWIACKNYFGNKCAYCGLPIEEHYYTRRGITKLGDFHKEHKDDDGANDLSNCLPSCGDCNSSKRSNKFDIWYNPNSKRRGGKIYTEERYNKIIKWLTKDYKQYI